jgi:hypothetical protein
MITVKHEHYKDICGHIISNGKTEVFNVDHPEAFSTSPREDDKTFAERLVRETFGDKHVQDLSFADCQIVRD